jgi:hypothetical protein
MRRGDQGDRRRGARCVGWAAALLAACAGAPAKDPALDSVVDDPATGETPAESDVDASETPGGETPSDSDAADSDVVGDTPAETDVADSDAPVAADTPVDSGEATPADPPPPSPPSFGAGFVEIAGPLWAVDPSAPVAPDRASREMGELHWAFFGDMFDDGVPDVYVAEARRVPTDTFPKRGQVFSYDAATGALTWNAAATAAAQRSFGPLVAIVDMDGDGLNDLVRANSQGTLDLRRGQGWMRRDGGRPAGVAQDIGGMYVSTMMDLDRDGWLDLVFAPDVCNRPGVPSVWAMLRTGTESWAMRGDLFPLSPQFNAVAVQQAPSEVEGVPWVMYVGDGCEGFSHATTVLEESGTNAEGYPVWAWIDPFPADALFRYDPAFAFLELGSRSPMGSAVFDADADGVLDYAVTLSDPFLHLFSFAPTGVGDLTGDSDILLPSGGAGGVQLPWGVGPIDLDRDGWPDILVTHGDDFDAFINPTPNGPYPLTAWWADGQGGYVEVEDEVGLTAAGQWNGLFIDDLDGDADPDVALGGLGQLPNVYRNDVDTGGGSLGIRLQGTTSNHLGMGAVVQVSAAGLPTQTRWMGEVAATGSFPSRTLFFGMAGAPATDVVTVRWPSGVVQEVSGLAVGAVHTLTEPPLVTLSEVDRHLPADGVSPLVVEVTPRAPDGAIRPVGAVEIELRAAPGLASATWDGPVERDGDTWRRTLRASPTYGSSVVEVTIDGARAPISPRVWWDVPTP